jgi:sodium-coupled neutral amino acid transporter 11
MSVSVSMRSLVCVLALGGVAALQVHPDSRLSTPRPMLRATTLVAAAAAAEDEGKAGLTASTANLVKSIVGSGVLSLPVGVAAFSSARTAILPALTLLAVAGAISGYCAPFAAAAPPHVAHAAPHASLHTHQHHAPCCSPPPPS